MSSAPRSVERGRRCAACGARNGPDAVWCTLCLAPLDAPAEVAARPDPAPDPEPGPATVPGVPGVPGVPQQRAPEDPRAEAGRAYAAAQAERLLAQLSAAETTPQGERIAAFHRAGPLAGMMFSLLGGLAAFLVLITLMALVGKIL